MEKRALFPKGSEWRKWDLHVHTPASFHWMGGKRLYEMTADEKEAAFQQMLDTINESDVAVFGVMDYWTFDGYLEFKKYVKEKGLELKKTVLPGIELRIESPTNYRLNIHVILSDKLSEQNLQDFKHCLKLRYTKRPLSDEALKEIPKHIGNDRIRVLGFDPNNMSEDDLYMCGAKAAEITRESLEQAIATIPKDTAFIILPFDTSDGLSRLNWKDHPLAATDFMKNAHMFETRKQETIDLFLGRKTEKNKHFIEDFQAAIGGKPKPPLSGSDAHKFSDYGVYPGNKITWIKADPTFEGLKQIIYEPETRVRIQENKPEEKTRYFVIDKVRFLDDSGKNIFPKDYLELNPNLNVIIGGKSSGKSLLLYYIAKAIDPKQVIEKIGDNEYDFDKDENFNFEVLWLDGTRNNLREEEDKKSNHQITYIPQMYIHKLADEKGQDNLRKLILDILLQDQHFNEFYTQQQQQILKMKSEIERDIIELFNLKSEVEKEKEILKKAGNKESVKEEIKLIKLSIDEIRKKSNLTEEENKIFNELNKEKEGLESEGKRLKQLYDTLSEYRKTINDLTNAFSKSVIEKTKELKIKLDDKGVSILRNVYYKIKQHVDNIYQVNDDAFSVLGDLEKSLSDVENKLKEINERLKPYTEKFENQSRINDLNKKLDYQQQLLDNIEIKEKTLNSLNEKIKGVYENILSKYEKVTKLYSAIVEQLQKEEYSQISEEIRLEVSLKFNTEKFFEQFTNIFNRRKKLNKIFEDCFDENDYLIYDDLIKHHQRINKIFTALLEEKLDLKIKSGNTLRDTVMKLFDDYFYIDYDLIQKNDRIMHMSPGKRGLVLLQLFLHLSNAQHPILIDQPEDNLDNRTIFTELTAFIKNKKIERQIILVTHNANLVVLTDAEEVIVANQAGQQVERENAMYRFEYVTGSLECTFEDKEAKGILYQKGIQEHVCEILEGGRDAFKKREEKYSFIKN